MPWTRGYWRPAPAKSFQHSASPWAVILTACAKLPPPTRVNSREGTPAAGRPPAVGHSPGLKCKSSAKEGGRILGIYLKAQALSWRLKFRLLSFSISASNPLLLEGMALGTHKHPSTTLRLGWNPERVQRWWKNDILGHTSVHAWPMWEEFVPTGL